MLPIRAAPAVCELDGPTITGPIISKILIMETLSFLTIIWEKHIISAAKKRVKFRSAHCDY